MKNIAIVLFLAILTLASVASAGEDFSEVPLSQQGVCVGADKITDPLLAALFCKKLAIQWYNDHPDLGSRRSRYSTKAILVLDGYYSPDKITGRTAWSSRKDGFLIKGGKGEGNFVARIEDNTLYVILSETAHIEIIITQKDGAFTLKGTWTSSEVFYKKYGDFEIIE